MLIDSARRHTDDLYTSFDGENIKRVLKQESKNLVGVSKVVPRDSVKKQWAEI
ncbi:hypothetical protein H5410_053321 [Solanum commersonii]|uniref:Uncharacterized protein n=1 Tax=Solanum commersonii TaxID=4109 RepID=A0A9J5X625_SOLCO|nr:hypothetical protein H5410_053321 [Solanum commersonii]